MLSFILYGINLISLREIKMIGDDKIDFVNGLSNEDVADVISILASRLCVWEQNDGVSCLTDVENATLNGAFVHINPKHRHKRSKNPKELTREQLYSVLIGKFHDDVWHCSRTEDGLVEIQFYVKED
jgi:hypothetical protein